MVVPMLRATKPLTLSAWQAKTDTCADSVDPDETAVSSGSTLFAIPFFFLFYFTQKPLSGAVNTS